MKDRNPHEAAADGAASGPDRSSHGFVDERHGRSCFVVLREAAALDDLELQDVEQLRGGGDEKRQLAVDQWRLREARHAEWGHVESGERQLAKNAPPRRRAARGRARSRSRRADPVRAPIRIPVRTARAGRRPCASRSPAGRGVHRLLPNIPAPPRSTTVKVVCSSRSAVAWRLPLRPPSVGIVTGPRARSRAAVTTPPTIKAHRPANTAPLATRALMALCSTSDGSSRRRTASSNHVARANATEMATAATIAASTSISENRRPRVAPRATQIASSRRLRARRTRFSVVVFASPMASTRTETAASQ